MRQLFAWIGLLLLLGCSDKVGPIPSADTGRAGVFKGAEASEHAAVHAAEQDPAAEVPPSYALRFLEQAAREPERWEARLIERNPHGRLTFWSWRTLLQAGENPRLTYESIEQPARPGVEVFAEVRQRGGDWLARALVPSSRGLQLEPVDLQLVQVAVFGGGLIDAESEPVLNAELRLYQAKGAATPVFYTHPHLAWTDSGGEFRFGGVEPGFYWLRVVTEGREPVVLQLDLKGGDSEAYELKMSTLGTTEELPIAVLGVSDQHLPSVLLALRSLDGQAVRRVAHPRLAEDPLAQLTRAGVGYAGLFPFLPEGSYELSVLGLDSNPYEPANSRLDFSALPKGVRVQAVPYEEIHELRFSVSDKESREALHDCYLRFSSADWWAPESLVLQPTEKGAGLSPEMPTPEWMVGRVGYQPVFGVFDPRSAQSQGELHEQVELIRGWGCHLLFRDGSQRLPEPGFDSWRRTGAVRMAEPLKDVLVFADGELVGRSDGAGRIRLQLPQAPRELRFQKDGLRELPHYLTGFVDAHDLDRLASVGSTVVWFDQIQ